MNLLGYIVKLIIKVFSIFPINNKKILIINFYGKGYSENPKYLCDELLKYNKYKIYWAVNNINDDFPKEIKKVKYNSVRYFFQIATSKLWISNVRLPFYFTKRKKQIYIQTWHGGLGFKKIEYDVFDSLSDNYKKNMLNDNKMTDYFISNSKWFENLIHNTFKSNAKILKYGFPKEDRLFTKEKDKTVYEKFGIKNKKIILYAPTFRNNYEHNPYDIDFKKLLNELNKDSLEEWVVAIKMHPNVHDYKNLISFDSENVIDVNACQDTQNLVVNCDLLISDYSSVLFDGLIANVPTLIYASDIEEYLKERGFYFDIKKLPFPLSTNTKELCKIINNNYLKNYKEKYKEFLNEVDYYSQGDSSKKIASFINDLI